MPEVTGSSPVSSTINMTHGRIGLIVSLACAVGLALAPAVALAGRSQGRPGGGAVGHGRPSGFHHGGATHHVAPRPHHGGFRHVGPRPFVRRVVPFGVAAAPLIYAPPLVYGSALPYDSMTYDPYAYATPPLSYGPNTGGAIALAPSPPPAPPTVVEFPTGRYELRGDGMAATPYTWVWIPNPPSAPPSQAPDLGQAPPSSHRQLYRWTDETGVAHWTDRGDAVPEQYRAQAQQPRLR